MTPMPVPGARAAFRWPAARIQRQRPDFDLAFPSAGTIRRHPFAVFIAPHREADPRTLSCPGSSRVGGWLASKASWPGDDDSCCRPPADPARQASRLSLADRCRARIARQPAAAHRRAGQQQSIDWLSSGTALAKPNWPTTGVPSGRPVQMPIRYRALRPTAHASR